ncbi:hypothetical protein M9458_019194 [Cirrhinus mrigala]|uniref:Gypsy retrotransposon integrase-like protein 1 n=1 Tax=Cirrhinus mrigala TaxID=683832 RepID=A0ABD0QCQ3_CIRMR
MSTETPATANPLTELVNVITAAGFLLQINLFIQMQPQQFPSENAKVAFLISLLTGKALQWAKAIWNSDNPIIHSYEQFTSHFSDVFSTTTGQLSTSDLLFRLQQGNSTINEYTLHFRTLATASGWNETTLLGAYRQGLNPQIRAAMALYDDSIGLEAFLQRTTRVSQRLAACQPSTIAPQPTSVVACTPVPEPMQVGSSRLTRSERNRRIMNGLCLYCGQSGHLLRTCPIRPPRPVVSTLSTEVETASLTLVPITLHTPKTSLCVSALIDSGSSGNFISQACLEKLQLQRCLHQHTLSRQYRENHWGVGKSSIHHLPSHCRVPPSASSWDARGFKYIILNSAGIPAIIIRWSEHCQSNCLVNIPTSVVAPVVLASTQILQQPYPLPLVPAALEELRGAQVFTKLDLRSAYNLVCAGDEWKAAFVTPTGHYENRVMPYGLSISPSVFKTFMNEVFREFLHRFVVVYIDDILIYSQNMAEHRQHIQQMDQGKVQAILDWPQPTTIKELQRFLGFSNFYRRFIQNYSSITAPLTSLLRGKPNNINWNPSAHEAFNQLKQIFSTAPLLHYPDPKKPFTVEVDASTTGVGAVLLQAVDESPLLHPCAYYSRKLSPAEQNYDVGNGELLAIKLALEEWRHWLEGATHPFTITDHKNLQYLREARRLNPRQARWALLFTRFHFTITYRPGSKNTFADALSRQLSPDQSTEPETIIPSDLIISPIQWDLDQNIRNATLQEPALPECPEGKIYVPQQQRQGLLGTVPQSLGSGHPGSQRTLSLLQSRYWWPSMRRDTIRYVQSCSVCAMSTSPRQVPSGKLVPLPIPQRPWSHLGVDFVTDLLAAEGNTCILVAVDRFSKMCKFVPFRGLPTVMETAELLFQHLFRHFGLPEEIVSDRGPQFISHVWKAFFKLLGVSIHLSSGYHPQTNGQTERKIQELGRYLRAYCYEEQHSWNRFLLWAEYAQNSLCQDTTGMTPFQCVLGYQPPLFPWTEEPSNVPAVDYWFRESERVWDSAHHHLQWAVQHHKRFADRQRRPAPDYQPGEQNTWELKRNPLLLKSWTPSIYTVHDILDSRRRGGHLEYPVDLGGVRTGRTILDFHREMPGPSPSAHSPQPPPSDTPPQAPPTRSSSPEY